MTTNTPVALTIAGSDSSGGAGIQADLKTFSAFGVYGASVITALTAQNTRGVQGVHAVPPDFVASQLQSVLGDVRVTAIKTGMLANAGIITAVLKQLNAFPDLPLIVDPVMVATSGDALLADDAINILRNELLPRATLVTPNMPEAARLLGLPVAETIDEQTEQACRLLDLGCRAVLLKGGHGSGSASIDVLATPAGVSRITKSRVETRNSHGTGCTLSAAIAALLASGIPLDQAVIRAKHYVWQALDAGRTMSVVRDPGSGAASHGPVDHLYQIKASTAPA